MMGDLAYGYAATRVKAMQTRLLTPKQWTDLFNVSSLPEMTVMLQETSYKDALVHASQRHAGVELILNGLQEDWLATLKKVERVLPEKAKPALDVMLGEWEVQDIKTISAKKALGQDVSLSELSCVTESGRKMCEKLMERKTWAELVDAITNTPYGELIKKDEKRIIEQMDFRALSSGLDRAYAQRISEVVKGKAHPNTRMLLQMRQDFLQTMIVLRLKSFASSADIEKELYGKPSATVAKLLDAKDLDEAVAQLELPPEALGPWKERRSLSVIELALEQRFFQSVLRKFRSAVLNFGVIIGYLYLKNSEVNNLKRLALGKYFGVEEQFRPFMVKEVTL